MNAIPLTGLALTGAALTAVPRIGAALTVVPRIGAALTVVPRIGAARTAVPLNREAAAICGLLQRLGLTTVGAWSNF